MALFRNVDTKQKKLRVTRDSCAKERSFTNEQELNKNRTKWRLHVSHKWSPRNVTHSKMDTIKILQVQHNWKLLLNLSVPHTEFPFSWPNLNLQNTSNLLADNCTRSRGFTNIMDSLHSFPLPRPPWAVSSPEPSSLVSVSEEYSSCDDDSSSSDSVGAYSLSASSSLSSPSSPWGWNALT